MQQLFQAIAKIDDMRGRSDRTYMRFTSASTRTTSEEPALLSNAEDNILTQAVNRNEDQKLPLWERNAMNKMHAREGRAQ